MTLRACIERAPWREEPTCCETSSSEHFLLQKDGHPEMVAMVRVRREKGKGLVGRFYTSGPRTFSSGITSIGL